MGEFKQEPYKITITGTDYMKPIQTVKVKTEHFKLPDDIKLEDVCIDDFTHKWMKKTTDEFARKINADWYDAMAYAAHDIHLTKKACKDKTHGIKRVIFSDVYTIVIWNDGTKTMVKCDENYDKEKGLAMAIAKKFLGTNKNKSDYFDVFKKWIPELAEEEKPELMKEITFTTNIEPLSYVNFKNGVLKALALDGRTHFFASEKSEEDKKHE